MRRLWIALCGGIVLEDALDLSSDRILNNNNKEGHFTVSELAWQFRGKSSELLELFYPYGFTTIRSHNTADRSSLQHYFLRRLQVFWDMTPCGLVNIIDIY